MRAEVLARRLSKLLLITLLISTVVPCTITIKAQESDLLTVEEAYSIAYYHVLRERKNIPEWQGALPGSPKTHYDLNGCIAAYIFSVIKGSEDVGYITVSGQALANPVLEFSTAPARHKMFQAAVRSTVERLGLTINEQKPLYLGMLAYFYRVGSQEPARLIEMGNQRVVTLNTPPVPPIQSQTSNPPTLLASSPRLPLTGPARARATEQSTVYKLLYGPNYSWHRGCAPTAAANVMGHWADRGYPNLESGGPTDTINQLADLMGTSPDGRTWTPINDDIINFAASRGYSFESSELYMPAYSTFVTEIDAHRPLVVLVNGHVYYGDHFITGFGYEYNPNDPNHRYMIVHDTWDEEDHWVQYGVGYSKIRFVTVIPPSVWADTTPPTSAVNPLPAYQASEKFVVSWSGSDEGWGIKWYDIQYRDGLTGDWTILHPMIHNPATQINFRGNRGHTYYFRSRAMDIDHNQESYPGGDGDTHTTVAEHVVSGYVKGNCDLPVMTAEVTVSPLGLGTTAFTDPHGLYQVGVAAVGTYSLTVRGNAPFGSLPPMERVDVSGDIDSLNFVLPPADDLIVNGGFETGTLDRWSASGIITPTITTAAHTGGYAVLLGQNPPPSGGSSIISQTSVVSPTLEQPVLSFMFKPGTADPGYDSFIAVLTAPMTTVTHTLPLTSTGWQHAWYDLSELAGRSVQIRFEVHQDSAANPTTVFVDEVSLGSASKGPSRVHLPVIAKWHQSE